VALFTVPIVAGTAGRSITKKEKSYAIKGYRLRRTGDEYSGDCVRVGLSLIDDNTPRMNKDVVERRSARGGGARGGGCQEPAQAYCAFRPQLFRAVSQDWVRT
jgi:hypothetical protein